MATSGTTAFNLNIDEVIDEGYERCGLQTSSGLHLQALRVVNNPIIGLYLLIQNHR